MPPVRLVLVALLACLAVPEDATAAPLRCGAVVDESAVLDRDLRCDGVAIVLRNPRSVLHLNGHTIESSRSCADGAAPSGVAVERTAEGAQILGPGLVRGFVTGIALGEAVRAQVREVRVADSCAVGILVVGSDGVRVRDVLLHRNGTASDDGAAIRVEQSSRFFLEGSDVFANHGGAKSAAVDLRDCDNCRIVANRIVANAEPGLRLDQESRGTVVERNVVLDSRGRDLVDSSNDGTYVLNSFERGDGIQPPALSPATGPPAPALPAPAGCGVMHVLIAARGTETVQCPPTSGARAVRNGVVAYRLLNPLSSLPFHVKCEGVETRAPDGSAGGSVRCTNPERTYPALLEVTCCLQ
jgi:hypothetical protein